jgi:hypothetical protein
LIISIIYFSYDPLFFSILLMIGISF